MARSLPNLIKRVLTYITDESSGRTAGVTPDGQLKVATAPTEYTTVTVTTVALNASTYTSVLSANTSRIGYILINYDASENVRFAEASSVAGESLTLALPLDAASGVFDSRDQGLSWRGEIVAKAVANTPTITIMELT